MNVVELPTTIPQQETITFDDFWALYPRREAKKDALKAWRTIPPQQYIEILTSLAAWRPVLIERSEGRPQFIKLPATWLRGECWMDELPQINGHASHAPAVMPARGERTEMPEHVREMIERMRRK